MIFEPDFFVVLVGAARTLEPGDPLSTGTPEGVGPLQAGDPIEVEVERTGVLRNLVATAWG